MLFIWWSLGYSSNLYAIVHRTDRYADWVGFVQHFAPIATPDSFHNCHEIRLWEPPTKCNTTFTYHLCRFFVFNASFAVIRHYVAETKWIEMQGEKTRIKSMTWKTKGLNFNWNSCVRHFTVHWINLLLANDLHSNQLDGIKCFIAFNAPSKPLILRVHCPIIEIYQSNL